MTPADFEKHLTDGAVLDSVTVKVNHSNFDPTPGEADDIPLSGYDLLVLLNRFPPHALRRMSIRADSGGEFGRVLRVTKRELTLRLFRDGSSDLEFVGDECPGD